MKNYVWQYEQGWGVFCAETDRLIAWHEFYSGALRLSDAIALWSGPDLLGPTSQYFNPEVIIQ